MPHGESAAHRHLKHLALEWARTSGFVLGATEVSLPRCNFRADVATATKNIFRDSSRIAIFECKQSRSDWLTDTTVEAATRKGVRDLAQRVHDLRQLVAVHRPDLRLGETLFPEFDAYDYCGLRHDTLQTLERKLRILQRKLIHGVKFDRLGRYACCHLRYVVTEDEIAEPHEIPVGWGWLRRKEEQLELVAKPVLTECRLETRIQVLERIARAGTKFFGDRNRVERATSRSKTPDLACPPRRRASRLH